MALRGTVKWLSRQHEEIIAQVYGGRVSPSSGAHDGNDVETPCTFIECKLKGQPGAKEHYSYSIKLKDLEKIVDEGAKRGKDGAIAIRLYAPESSLADVDGWVDLTVRLASDDASRDQILDFWGK